MGFSGGFLGRSVTVTLLSFLFLSFSSSMNTHATPKEPRQKTSPTEGRNKTSAAQQVKALCSKLVSLLPKKRKLTPEEYQAMKRSGQTTVSTISATPSLIKPAKGKAEKPIDSKKEAALIVALKDFQFATNQIQETLSSDKAALRKDVLITLFNSLKRLAVNGVSLETEANKIIFSSLMRYYSFNPAFIIALQRAVRSKTISSGQVALFDSSILAFVRTVFTDYESSLSAGSPEYQLIHALRSGSPNLGTKLKVDQSWKLAVSLWMRDQAALAIAKEQRLKTERSQRKIDEDVFAKRRQEIREDYWYVGSWQAKQNHYRQLSSQLRRTWGSIRALKLQEISSLAALKSRLQENTKPTTETTVLAEENVFDIADFNIENDASGTNPGIDSDEIPVDGTTEGSSKTTPTAIGRAEDESEDLGGSSIGLAIEED